MPASLCAAQNLSGRGTHGGIGRNQQAKCTGAESYNINNEEWG